MSCRSFPTSQLTATRCFEEDAQQVAGADVPFGPVAQLQRWLEEYGIHSGEMVYTYLEVKQ